jgi:NAD(P)-dependent dehydrogenase (short-subunit alcohol dehydrogenase family)
VSTILVLGASRGIGMEFVRQYREAGDRVIATARNEAALAALKKLGAETFKLDVADPASVSGLAWHLDSQKIDVALYVAGVYSTAGATTPPTREEFDRLMHTNVLGAMQAMPQVAPLVEAAGGRFAFITSGMGRIADASSSFGWTYRASKAALNMAVHAASGDYPKATLVVIDPGWVRTDMGGPGASLAVEDSVAGMRDTIAKLKRGDSGGFFRHDGGRHASW